jgi:hypothetical protein
MTERFAVDSAVVGKCRVGYFRVGVKKPILDEDLKVLEGVKSTSIYKTGIYKPGIYRSNNPLDEALMDLEK